MATRTNDEIKQYDAEFFAYDSMWLIDKRRTAVLADSSHAKYFSKGCAIPSFTVAKVQA